jgi:hypothetical protein
MKEQTESVAGARQSTMRDQKEAGGASASRHRVAANGVADNSDGVLLETTQAERRRVSVFAWHLDPK